MSSSVDQERPTLLLKAFGRLLDLSERLNVRFSKFGNPPVYDPNLFPWSTELERNWRRIRGELDAILPRRDELPNFQDISADVGRIQRDSDWKPFFLYGYGVRSEQNCRACPETVRLLGAVPGMKTAFFSLLAPGKWIPPHRGPYNGVLRYHLGLLVPKPSQGVRIRVHDQFCGWQEGKSLIFDDSFEHEVWNESAGVRVVLFVDFLRPVRFPASLLQHLILWAVKLTPFIKAAEDRHSRWEKAFYGKPGEETTARKAGNE